MKFFIQSPDDRGYIDAPILHMLRHLPLADRWQDADCVVIPTSRTDNYRFHERLYEMRRPWVNVEMSEFFWDDPQQTTRLWGQNMLDFPWFQQNDAWQKFDQFVRDNPPKMQWVRELLRKDVTTTVQPIEFLCYAEPQRPQSKDDFYARPIGLFHNWGRSHEARVQLQGDIWKGSSHFGYDAVGSWDHLDAYVERKMPMWAPIHSPDFKRVDISTFLHWSRRSKLTAAWPGCGFKTFRHAEAPVGSIMVMTKNDLAWTYPWTHGENCCLVDIGTGIDTLADGVNAVPAIYEFLKRDDLHTIYERGLETVTRYRPRQFFDNHFIPTVGARL